MLIYVIKKTDKTWEYGYQYNDKKITKRKSKSLISNDES
jgi:hypothetical protein